MNILKDNGGRCYDPLSLATAAALAGFAGKKVIDSVSGPKDKSSTPAAAATSGKPNASQTVDPQTSSAMRNLGRAALIMTSPQGVLGTNPTGRYRLLGNT